MIGCSANGGTESNIVLNGEFLKRFLYQLFIDLKIKGHWAEEWTRLCDNRCF